MAIRIIHEALAKITDHRELVTGILIMGGRVTQLREVLFLQWRG